MTSAGNTTAAHPPTRLVVLISGTGTNLSALLSALHTPRLPATTVALVVANRRSAKGLERAAAAAVPTHYHNLVAGGYRARCPGDEAAARRAYDRDLAEVVLAARPDVVVCAGWMHVLGGAFLGPVAERGVAVVNLHPALPGEYNGANAIERAFADYEAGRIKRTGCMVHYVIEEVDMGEPIVTAEVGFRTGDTLAAVEARMHEKEHEIIVEGTRRAIEQLATARPS